MAEQGGQRRCRVPKAWIKSVGCDGAGGGGWGGGEGRVRPLGFGRAQTKRRPDCKELRVPSQSGESFV